jgi:hypothetical protein
MSTEEAEHDEAFIYADAMACALASVVLLLFTALVKIGAGKGTTDAYAVLTLELMFDKPIRESGVVAEVYYRSDLFARVTSDGLLKRERAAQDYRLSLGNLKKDRLVLETLPDRMPAVSFSLESWPSDSMDNREQLPPEFVWTSRLMIRWPAASEAFDWEWRFDNPKVPSPRRVVVSLSDHTVDRDHRSLQAKREVQANNRLKRLRVQVDEGSVAIPVFEVQP